MSSQQQQPKKRDAGRAGESNRVAANRPEFIPGDALSREEGPRPSPDAVSTKKRGRQATRRTVDGLQLIPEDRPPPRPVTAQGSAALRTGRRLPPASMTIHHSKTSTVTPSRPSADSDGDAVRTDESRERLDSSSGTRSTIDDMMLDSSSGHRSIWTSPGAFRVQERGRRDSSDSSSSEASFADEAHGYGMSAPIPVVSAEPVGDVVIADKVKEEASWMICGSKVSPLRSKVTISAAVLLIAVAGGAFAFESRMNLLDPPRATSLELLVPSSSPSSRPSSEDCFLDVAVGCSSVSGAAKKECDSITALCKFPPFSLSFRYLGGSCMQSISVQPQSLFSCEDLRANHQVDVRGFIRAIDTKGRDVVYFEGHVAVGEEFSLLSHILQREQPDDVNITVYSSEESLPQNILQTVVYSVKCDMNLYLGDTFGSIQLLSFANNVQGLNKQFLDANYTTTVTNTGSDDVMLTSLTSTSDLGDFNLTDDILEIVVSPGHSIERSMNVQFDQTVFRMYNFSVSVEGRSPYNLSCAGFKSLAFSAGKPDDPEGPTIQPTATPIAPTFIPTADPTQVLTTFPPALVPDTPVLVPDPTFAPESDPNRSSAPSSNADPPATSLAPFTSFPTPKPTNPPAASPAPFTTSPTPKPTNPPATSPAPFTTSPTPKPTKPPAASPTPVTTPPTSKPTNAPTAAPPPTDFSGFPSLGTPAPITASPTPKSTIEGTGAPVATDTPTPLNDGVGTPAPTTFTVGNIESIPPVTPAPMSPAPSTDPAAATPSLTFVPLTQNPADSVIVRPPVTSAPSSSRPNDFAVLPPPVTQAPIIPVPGVGFPTSAPSPSPTASTSPSASPSNQPSVERSEIPSPSPSIRPTVVASESPSAAPSAGPSAAPFPMAATIGPSSLPAAAATSMPTDEPITEAPIEAPTEAPTDESTVATSDAPTATPSADQPIAPVDACSSINLDYDWRCVLEGQPASDCESISLPNTRCRDRPFIIVFRFNGAGCSDSTSASLTSCLEFQGGTLSEGRTSTVYAVVTEEGDDDNEYFAGFVTLGGIFQIDAFGAILAADMTVTFYSSNDRSPDDVIHSLSFHSSCSQDFHLLDQLGPIQLISFANEQQGQVSTLFLATFTATFKNEGTLDVTLDFAAVAVSQESSGGFAEDLDDDEVVLASGESFSLPVTGFLDASLGTYNVEVSTRALTGKGYECGTVELYDYPIGAD